MLLADARLNIMKARSAQRAVEGFRSEVCLPSLDRIIFAVGC